MTRLYMVAMIFLLLCGVIYAGEGDVGTTAYPFLKIGVGAKALAMGGAFVGLADDESAAYYNPAGIIGFQQKAVAASYMNYVADIQSGYLSLVLPTRGTEEQMRSGEFDEVEITDAARALAFSVNYLNYGTLDRTNADGEVEGDFGGSEFAVGLTYARRLGDRVTLAGTGKFIYQKIDEFSSDALAADLGLIYRFKDGRTSFGLAATNLGFQLSGLSPENKDPLPIAARAGISHHLRELPVTASGEISYPTDNKLFGSIGLEFSQHNFPLALRAGYSTFGSNYKTGGDKDNTAGFAFGAGFFLGHIAIDYAFVPYADLGSLHRVSLAHRW
ncbi:MAG: PorV/PorQ family protein [bacterium]